MKKRVFSKMWRPVLLAAVVLISGVQAAALFGGAETTGDEGAPTALEAETATYRDVPCVGFFKVVGGGAATFSVAEAPAHGSVKVEGNTFRYTPSDGHTGTDSFTYTATDEQGRTSAPATVRVRVQKRKTDTVYNDMLQSEAYTAAIHLAEEGVYTGEKLGSESFFYPEDKVSRSEFLTMTMSAMDLAALDKITVTGFSDDEAIPTWAKGYVSAALKEGIVQGVSTAEGVIFDGDSPVTFNEAATILNRILEIRDVDVSAWQDSSWAGQAVANLESVSVMAAGSFGSARMEEEMTRGEVAQLLSATMDFADEKEESQGVFGWLFS